MAETAIGLPALDPEQETASVVGFDAGYVAYVSYLRGPDISFSADGVEWEQISLPPSGPHCEDEDYEGIVTGATNGRSALLLAEYATAEECSLQTYAWVTHDGRTWRRSGPIGDPRGITEAEPLDAWAVPDGWEAAVGTDDDETAILHSADGVNWTQTATLAAWGSVDGAADAGGNRMLSLIVRGSAFGDAFQEKLVTSVDGLTWNALDARFDRSGNRAAVSAVVPLAGTLSPWILVVDEWAEGVSYPDDSYRGRTLWRSDDLSHWEPISTPAASTSPLSATSEGLLATACTPRGSKCGTHITPDARQWTPVLGSPAEGALQWVAEGPAGVLAGTAEGSVYRLVP